VAVRTYIDSGVLIAAFKGDAKSSAAALSFLNDPLREYITSDYVKIELLPKSVYHKNQAEQDFYETYFKRTSMRVPSSDALLIFAIEEGGKTGILGIDAIHVACAVVAQAADFVTVEKSQKPIHRANGVNVISINP
jgi:predicted nucleic acid-binding protein